MTWFVCDQHGTQWTSDPQKCPECLDANAPSRRLYVLLASWRALLPTSAYAVIARAMAEELRGRGEYDASNYLVKAATAMEG